MTAYVAAVELGEWVAGSEADLVLLPPVAGLELDDDLPAVEEPLPETVRLAAGYLFEHGGATREAYGRDLRVWVGWCAALGIGPLAAGRVHVAEHRRQLLVDLGRRSGTVARFLAAVAGFYRYVVEVGALERSLVPDRCLHQPRGVRN